MTIKNARKLASAALVSEDAAFFLQELSENVKNSLNFQFQISFQI